MTFIAMEKQGRYFNPSRASPLDINVREGYRGQRDAYIGKKPAIARTLVLSAVENSTNLSQFYSMVKSGNGTAAS
jgi:hypothetical protein